MYAVVRPVGSLWRVEIFFAPAGSPTQVEFHNARTREAAIAWLDAIL